MKAKEVLAKYAEGEKDFRRVNLRGQSFKGQDLSGTDFQGADIRGTNFTGANLTGVNFQEVRAGLQWHWMIAQLLLSSVLAAISAFFSIFAVTIVTLSFNSGNLENQIAGWVALTVLVIFSITLLYQGVNFTSSSSAVAIAALVTGAVVSAVSFFVSSFNSSMAAFTIAFAVAFVSASVGTFAAAGSFTAIVSSAVSLTVTGANLAILAFTMFLTFVVAFTLASASVSTFTAQSFSIFIFVEEVTYPEIFAYAVSFTGTLIILSTYIGWQAMKGDEKYTLIRTIAVALAAIGGTNFRQANLTEADFYKATLKNTDFRKANLTHTHWKDILKLDLARLGKTYLGQKLIRELILTNNGYKKSYQGLNLRGVNLAGANLEAANLKKADLGEANLRQANLKNANLTEINAVATDFTNATLTGACLEAWNIDHTTELKDIDCQYIYFLEHPNHLGNRERRPHNQNAVFAPGDFSKLFQEVLNVVQLLIRDGLNPEAFQQAFQKIMAEHPGVTRDSIQKVEKKGQDVLVTLEVPEETDKGNLEKDFQEVYQAKLEAAKNAALLESEKSHNQQITQLFSQLLTKQQQNFDIKLENKPVNENKSDSRQFTIGDVSGDFKPMGSALNAGDVTISGTVAETINQLPPSPNPEKPGIKELLSQLVTAIEAEDNLDEEEKQDALEQIQNLAKAGQNPQEGAMKKLAKKAMTMLKGLTVGLPAAAGLAKAVKELLPMIGSIFSLE